MKGTDSPGRRLRVDMHTHCDASPDCTTSVEEQAQGIRVARIDVVCATDHNTIEGALRLQDVARGFRVVVGEEIRSADGEIIGLFLDRVVPPDLPAEETISMIKEQGGLVVVPHPFSPTRPSPILRPVLERLWPQIDALEVINGRREFPADNRRAAEYARERRIPGAAGSDAHRASDVGRAFVEVADFTSPDEFLDALADGSVHQPGSLLRDLLGR